MTRHLLPVLGLALGLLAAASAQEQTATFWLSIGDPRLRDKDATVVLDGITETASGTVISPADLPSRLQQTRLLLLGESHTSVESHRVQLRVIEALFAAGRRVLIGLEMFPVTEQKYLDQWREGLLTEEGFVKLSRWYEHWGYHWHYYRDIFVFARDHGLQLYAVNTPREIVTAVRRKGFANLTPEEASHLPPDGVDVDSPDQMTLFRASFDEDDTIHGGMTDDAWKAMLSAQATWDATMGWHAVQSLRQAEDPNAIMVVLVGSGHVAYGLGIERQARRWFDGGISTLIPVPVFFPAENLSVDRVRASYANFVWGVPPEHDSDYPTLGISTIAGEGGRRVVLEVKKDSPAARAGFEVNDVLLSMDGTDLPDREVLNALMSRKDWGDEAVILVKRGSEDKTLTAYFRRTPPRAAPPAPREPSKSSGERKKTPPRGSSATKSPGSR